jgi:hypothetical protein
MEEISIKLINKGKSEIETKTRTGKNSIYVEVLQSLTARKMPITSEGFLFNIKDPITGNLIRPSTMLEAHIACGDEVSKLPRMIVKEDRKVKFGSNFFDMFRTQYQKVFGYNLVIEENVKKNGNRKRVKGA